MNDRDSDALVIQSKRLPDAMRVITGRFERNPPRYYQMRIERVQRELKSNPYQFGLYDDLAVANDRLGDDIMAMRVMSQKRALLPTFNSTDKANKEAWYRYFANDGTFRVHRFLHEGAKIERIAELKRARAEIHRAIQIKPNAHFGRERVQLMVMDWILAKKKWKTNKTLGQWIEGRDGWQIDYGGEPYWAGKGDDAVEIRKGDSAERITAKERHRRETAEGLAGLVVLGSAWNSPDVFEALASALDVEKTVALRYLALLRCRELLNDKNPSFAALSVSRINTIWNDNIGWAGSSGGLNDPNKKTLNESYLQLRQEADKWNASRAKWMETKFALGQHPDSSPTFWQGYTEISPPSLDVPWFNQAQQTNRLITGILILAALLFIGLPTALIVLLVVHLRKRARSKTASA